jgi:toxin ParE1/3/4
MKPIKPIIHRAQFERDVEESLAYYEEESIALATQFIDKVEQALKHIANYPGTGSSRYAHELNLPNLKSWILKQFPYVIFYIERADYIDVWRLLHMKSDIPSWMV